MLDLKELSKQIRNVRLEKNFSMEEVAKQANITRATLSEIEKGNPNCAFGSYLKVLSILDIDVEFNSITNSKKRKRATRKILKIDKKINHWVVFTVELFSNYINKSTDYVFNKLQEKGLIDLLYNDYEDLHGMSPEYINDYLYGCFKKTEIDKPSENRNQNNSLTKTLVVADVIELIAKKYKVNLKQATKMYYTSSVAKMMSDDRTGMYGDSPLQVFSTYEMYH